MVGKYIERLRQEYENIFKDGSIEISMSQGKIHKYLGMNLNYTDSGIARIIILEDIDEILTAFNKDGPKQ